MNDTFAITLTLLSSGCGAYLGSYLKRKGENLATHEDIDIVVDQVKAVTEATKHIEAKISGDLWDRQKHWELKREILVDAVKRLSEVEARLFSLQIFWRDAVNGKIANEQSRITLEHKYVNEWQDAITRLQETESLVLLSCSKQTNLAIAEYCDFVREIASNIVSSNIVAYDHFKTERLEKLARARGGIRKELGIKLADG